MTTLATTPAPARGLVTYQIDKAHSESVFKVRHLLTKVRGRFSDFSGTIAFDEAQPAQSTVSFTIQAASIDTNQPDRDKHLRSADFFAVDEYPTLTFVSTRVVPGTDGHFDVVGDLTIRGISKSITLPVSHLGDATDPWGNRKVAFEAEITINRKDFGLNWNATLETGGFLVGDEVKVNLSVQAASA
jgi:polyisoprenoid-binding protein YceI